MDAIAYFYNIRHYLRSDVDYSNMTAANQYPTHAQAAFAIQVHSKLHSY